jgi:hypothetical protein
MFAMLFATQNPAFQAECLESTPYITWQSEPETVDLLQPTTPSTPSPLKRKAAHNTLSLRLITKHKKKRHYLLTKPSNAALIQAKLKRHTLWLKQRQRALDEQLARQEMLPELLRMPITRYICVHCAQGPYACDDEAPDIAAQEEKKNQILVCQKKLGLLSTWRKGKEKQSGYAAWWWEKANDNVLKRTAFDAWKLNRKPPTTTPTLDLSRATPAWMTYMQECGTYICKPCSAALSLQNNLDESKPSYCPGCYQQATRNDISKAKAENELRAASKAYKEARPDRGLVPTNDLPQPHTLLSNLRAKYLWVGGTGQKIIRKRPLNGHTYTRTEVDGLLRVVPNYLVNHFSNLQLPYTLVPDLTRPAALTVAECQHHFSDRVVEIVQQSGYVIYKGKFIHRAELSLIDFSAESDDPDNSDCDLEE